MSYWDTSALLKLYLTETDSADFHALAAATPRLVTGFIGKHEARTAFRRREAEQALAPGAANVCYQKLLFDLKRNLMEMVPESPPLEHEFGQVLEQCLSQSPPRVCPHERRAPPRRRPRRRGDGVRQRGRAPANCR